MANGNPNSVIKCAMTCMVVLLSAGNIALYWQAKSIRRLNDQTEKFLTSQGIRIVDSLDRISDRLDRPAGDCPWCGQRFMWNEAAKKYVRWFEMSSPHMSATLMHATSLISRIRGEVIKENEENKENK